jgi:heptaprenyl diphosphate synthase
MRRLYFSERAKSGWQPKDIARLGMMLALATALHIFESQLPSLPLPGARIGLANVVSLFALYCFGAKEAFLLIILRQVAGSVFTGTFFTPAFFFGLSGGLLSVAVMSLVLAVYRRASPIFVSLFGAVAHNIGQLLVAWYFTGQALVLFYLPYLLWFAIPAGALVGKLMELLLPYLKTTGEWKNLYTVKPHPRQRMLELGLGGLVAVVGALTLVFWVFGGDNLPLNSAEAVVRVDEREVLRLPLNEDSAVEIHPNGGHMIIEVSQGRVRVKYSDCENQVCVRTGWISSLRQAIVCVPWHTVVTIEGSLASDPYSDIDAFTQ